MPVSIIVLFVLTIVSIVGSAYLDLSKYKEYSYISKLVFSILLIVMSIVGFLISFEGINDNHLLYGILMLITIILYSLRNIVILIINRFRPFDRDRLVLIEVYSSMCFYIL